MALNTECLSSTERAVYHMSLTDQAGIRGAISRKQQDRLKTIDSLALCCCLFIIRLETNSHDDGCCLINQPFVPSGPELTFNNPSPLWSELELSIHYVCSHILTGFAAAKCILHTGINLCVSPTSNVVFMQG